MNNLHTPVLISPLHTADPEDEYQCKPHYHIMIDFDGQKSHDQVKSIWDSIGAVEQPGRENVQNKRGMARYFCHLDEKNKSKYETNEVICLSGFDYNTLINLPVDKYSCVSEMCDFIIEFSIVSFSQLVLYAKENNERWFRSLCDNSSYIMEKFIKSYHWEQTQLANLDSSKNLSFANSSEKE